MPANGDAKRYQSITGSEKTARAPRCGRRLRFSPALNKKAYVMNAKDAIKASCELERMVTTGYLSDLSEEDLMHRPCPGANHIKWQLGHLITSEHKMVDKVAPGSMPPLPDGFAEKYSKETAGSDDPNAFDSRRQLLEMAEAQRKGTLAVLETMSEADLDKPSGIDFAPTIGKVFTMQAGHWLMHAGQWAVIRRQLGRPPLF